MQPYLGPPSPDFHQIWAVEVFHTDIWYSNAEMQKRVLFVTSSRRHSTQPPLLIKIKDQWHKQTIVLNGLIYGIFALQGSNFLFRITEPQLCEFVILFKFLSLIDFCIVNQTKVGAELRYTFCCCCNKECICWQKDKNEKKRKKAT